MSERTLADLDTKELLILCVQLLSDIRDGIVAHVADDSDECEHPEDARVNLSSQGDLDHWICRLCKFDNKTAVMN